MTSSSFEKSRGVFSLFLVTFACVVTVPCISFFLHKMEYKNAVMNSRYIHTSTFIHTGILMILISVLMQRRNHLLWVDVLKCVICKDKIQKQRSTAGLTRKHCKIKQFSNWENIRFLDKRFKGSWYHNVLAARNRLTLLTMNALLLSRVV